MSELSLTLGDIKKKEPSHVCNFLLSAFDQSAKDVVGYLNSLIDHINDSYPNAGTLKRPASSSADDVKTKIQKQSSTSAVNDEEDYFFRDEYDSTSITLLAVIPEDIGLISRLIGKKGSNVIEVTLKAVSHSYDN